MSTDEYVDAQWNFPGSLSELPIFISLYEPNFLLCCLFTVLTPLLFNLVCTYEYNTKRLSELFRSPKVACTFFGICQIALSNTRNYYFYEAVRVQPKFETPFNDVFQAVGLSLMAIGALFVVTSFLRLGWFGTWHGDHFGMLLSEKVTGFPFNVMDHPMYDGAIMVFIGSSLMSRSIVGIAMSFFAQIVYRITESFEGPFTTMIYEQAALRKKAH